MHIYIDTASVEEIKQAHEWGVISGVTTNPSLVAKEGRDFMDVLKEVVKLVGDHIPVSAEVISMKAEGMLEEGRRLAAVAPNVVVKVPLCEEGLKATHIFAQEGIPTNVTLIFSSTQALLAARAGATYVSPFIGRLDDISQVGMKLIEEISSIFAIHQIESQIIAASVRHPAHVIEAALNGAHIATMPFKIIQQMIKHPLTDAGIERFLADWQAAGQNQI